VLFAYGSLRTREQFDGNDTRLALQPRVGLRLLLQSALRPN
jgi:hypothetical protein